MTNCHIFPIFHLHRKTSVFIHTDCFKTLGTFQCVCDFDNILLILTLFPSMHGTVVILELFFPAKRLAALIAHERKLRNVILGVVCNHLLRCKAPFHAAIGTEAGMLFVMGHQRFATAKAVRFRKNI